MLGDGIGFLGYDVQPAKLRASHILYLQLYWSVASAPTADWVVFTHVLTQDRLGNQRVVAGLDSQPGAGSLPTRQWQKGWRVLDEYQIKLPIDLKPGAYNLEIGLYKPSGERLPCDGSGLPLGLIKIE